MTRYLAPLTLGFTFALSGGAGAQSGHDQTAHSPTMDHSAHMAAPAPTETGQSAFAAIAEIVAILQADPDTDWDTVNITALREHLVDMDAVTLHAQVVTQHVEGGASFDITSDDPQVTGSIRRMTVAHGQTMSGTDGMVMTSREMQGGANMIVTGPDAVLIRGLGFFGVMTQGMHHQAHHFALALGQDPHN